MSPIITIGDKYLAVIERFVNGESHRVINPSSEPFDKAVLISRGPDWWDRKYTLLPEGSWTLLGRYYTLSLTDKVLAFPGLVEGASNCLILQKQ